MRSNLKQPVRTPEEVAAETSNALVQFGVKPTEKIKIVDPITKKESIVTLDRTGHNEARLITALANPDLSRDRKDHELSMYLFTRGAEGASMMLDLMRYKGEHTKETRVFKSQVRFDFEALVDILADHYEEQAKRTAKILGISLEKEMREYRAWLTLPNNKAKEYTYHDFKISKSAFSHPSHHNGVARLENLMISQAIFDFSEAQRLRESREKITKAREAEKGGGIFVDSKGRAYSINDPEIDEIIKADQEATREIEKP